MPNRGPSTGNSAVEIGAGIVDELSSALHLFFRGLCRGNIRDPFAGNRGGCDGGGPNRILHLRTHVRRAAKFRRNRIGGPRVLLSRSEATRDIQLFYLLWLVVGNGFKSANCLIINLPERASLPHVRNLPEKLRCFTLQKTLEVDHEVHHEGT